MSSTTSIEWTDTVLNPTTGCDRVSPGCDNCYALTMAKRLKAMGSAKYQTDGDPRTSGPGFGIAEHPDVLTEPLRWRKPRRVFVNSMSDLFHARVSTEFITRVWEVMAKTPQHTYQILSKRPQRMARVLEQVHQSLGITEPLSNVWLGTSVENQKYADLRIPALLNAPAAIRFLSCEPLLGPVDLCGPIVPGRGRPKLTYWLDGRPGWGPDQTDDHGRVFQELAVGPRIDWVITGAESGPRARPAHPDWFRTIRDQCVEAGVAYLHKQNGEWLERSAVPSDAWVSAWDEKRVTYVHPKDGRTQSHGEWGMHDHLEGWACVQRVGKKAAGRELDGRTWTQFPKAVTSR